VEIELMKEQNTQWSNYWNYDSKKETGYVGLKNQGATCYMNSLLQALYHTPTFRKSVYQLPTDTDVPTKSIPLALQRIFYRLQYGNTGVGTKELTKSFGWTAVDSFTQHDVQELNRVLMDNLQGKMKSTKAEGTIERLLQGRIRNFIKCVDIEFESNREEFFFDLSLNVKGCKDLYTSFDKYIEVEMLDGDNKYHAEGHGLQTAKKGCMFMAFPPILHLQLKRFEYDPMRDAMVKVNDRYV
jgi:ubiquitin carboxyl-terminal hydrolase 7